MPKAVPLMLSENGDYLHSLVMAAKTTPKSIDILLNAGADASFWTSCTVDLSWSEKSWTPSLLCVSTPSHAAISVNKLEAFEHLLRRGFNPNAQASIAGDRGLTVLQHAVALGNVAAVHSLFSHPLIDLDILTAVYSVLVVYSLVAQLRADLLTLLDVRYRWFQRLHSATLYSMLFAYHLSLGSSRITRQKYKSCA
jgi:hypothetical protein